jgi:G3E family GTPase
MSPKRRKGRVPVNLIAGSLGVGKTTTINHLLGQRPADQRWAVLVNEYGLVGLDAALLAGESRSTDVDIREVAGGCICCSAGFMFEASLVLLLQRRPDRLLIEPTGLAALSGILDTLAHPSLRDAVDLRSVVCLLDPRKIAQNLGQEQVREQVEAADVLLATRSDLATSDQLDGFETWANTLFPRKRLVARVERGRVPLAWLDLVGERTTSDLREAPPRPVVDHHHHHHHHHHAPGADASAAAPAPDIPCDAARPIVQHSHRSALASSVGWVCWDGLVFDADRATRWLGELARRPGVARAKAVLRTDRGWLGFNYAGDIDELRPSGHRRDSRLELLGEDGSLPAADLLEQELRACLVSPAAGADR